MIKKAFVTGLLAVPVAGLIVGACSSTSTNHAAAAPTHQQQAVPAQSTPAPTPSPTASSPAPASPAPSPTPTQSTVTFWVSGSAPTGAISPTVTYGPSGSDTSGSVPLNVSQPIPASPPSYYAINAQLSDAGGSIQCAIDVNGQQISSGTASGADQICSAEISPDPISGNWTDDNSGG